MMTKMSSQLNGSRRVDPISLSEELKSAFPDYVVTYSIMTDSFQIRNAHYRHRLQYNTHKPSRLDSQSAAMRRFTFLFNTILLGLMGLFIFMDQRWSWDLFDNHRNEDFYFFGLILVIGLLQYLIPVLRPELKRDLEAAHMRVRHILEEMLEK